LDHADVVAEGGTASAGSRKTAHCTPAGGEVRVSPGFPLPLGVRDCCDGFNFALFSRNAERVELLLYQDARDPEPWMTLALDAAIHRTGDVWHVLVSGIAWGQAYAYRVHGPAAPEQGHRFDSRLALLDPHALALAGTGKCLLVDRRFDWEGDRRPRHPWADTIIYEAHVRGLTVHPSAGSEHPGTFLGVIEKIPYLRALGVTALELMPLQEFDERSNPRRDPASGKPLANYWGYDTAAFFAPKEGYASRRAPGCQLDEFKTMVKALHRAGIEVILDVVFNHTAEGNENGRTLSFRGIDNAIYYMLEDDRRYYKNFTGCGNTLNCNHPVVRDFVIDCLRYWVAEAHVDGFRFDLASVLGRGTQGELLPNPPLLERIAEDPILRDVKLIAEAWDAAGAYQVGSFAGGRWAEWNGRYRDDVRRFWRGDPGMVGALAARLGGSADIYQRAGKTPVNSVNFITCHDGFTLNDLVAYAGKHNEANGEDGRDGTDQNHSANHGVEGPTDDEAIERLRVRQIKNLLATLLVSRGVPMILGGDEFGRTQRGNNNAYCQDNEVSWYDWSLLEKNAEIVRFVREMIALRKRTPVLRREGFYVGSEIRWFGPGGAAPDWSGPDGVLGCAIESGDDAGASRSPGLCLLFNAGARVARFELPATGPERRWRAAVDTASPPPADARALGEERKLGNAGAFELQPHAFALLVEGAQ